MDVYSVDQSNPVRIEWFGDDIESIRQFDLGSQRSIESIREVEITAVGASLDEDDNIDALQLGPITDHLPDDTLVIVVEPHDCKLAAENLLGRTDDQTGFTDFQSLMASMSHLQNGDGITAERRRRDNDRPRFDPAPMGSRSRWKKAAADRHGRIGM